MKGKLIVIEGSDGSGKATQTKELYNKMLEKNYKIKKVEYPNYKSESSALIKMYLNGEFGSNPEDVNSYVSSTFYAVDRFASYKKDWEKFYNNGGIILADRYTTSNMIHQGAKIDDKCEKEKFLHWLWNFEFNKFKLPKPDCVIFLDMPPEYSVKLINDRNENKDIHEKDINYLVKSYKNALYIMDKYNWVRIKCIKDGKLRTIKDIHNEIYNIIENLICS
jgi:dTMP kinase